MGGRRTAVSKGEESRCENTSREKDWAVLREKENGELMDIKRKQIEHREDNEYVEVQERR